MKNYSIVAVTRLSSLENIAVVYRQVLLGVLELLLLVWVLLLHHRRCRLLLVNW